VRPRSILIAAGLASLALAAAPRAALAQEGDVLTDFRLPTPRLPRDGFVTVRERPHPLYDPVPIRIGKLELLPSATADALYDSNIFATRDPTGDVALRGRIGTRASWISGPATVRADAALDRRQYLDHGSQSTTDYLLSSNLAYAVRRDTGLFAGIRAARETESLNDPAAPLNRREPSQYTSLSAYAGAAHAFDRLRIAGRVSAEDRSFSTGIDQFGEPIDQSFRDRTLYTAELGAEYAVSDATSLYAEGSLNRRDYRNRVAIEPARDSQGFRIEAGAGFMLTPLIRTRIGLGYFRQDFDSPAFSTIAGLAVRARLDYAVTQLLTLSVTGSRGVEEASTIGTGGYVASRVGLSADYELLRNLIISASAGYERDRFDTIDRRYAIKRAALSATWRLSPRLSLNAGYEGRDQDTSGLAPGRDFVRHQFTVGITLEGL